MLNQEEQEQKQRLSQLKLWNNYYLYNQLRFSFQLYRRLYKKQIQSQQSKIGKLIELPKYKQSIWKMQLDEIQKDYQKMLLRMNGIILLFEFRLIQHLTKYAQLIQLQGNNKIELLAMDNFPHLMNRHIHPNISKYFQIHNNKSQQYQKANQLARTTCQQRDQNKSSLEQINFVSLRLQKHYFQSLPSFMLY
ncbi:unnamed protein product [Paramecium primaurelia]|uniref:Uncharacterized protein n=1 Tax=Paramecium primaurelia TaxID=5886 RepID=A0A8S1MWV8_PARPR|nr:unnamed protein product [Paramecium primaurelia]